ncbi:cytochrome P450 [Aspergillus insuetus]
MASEILSAVSSDTSVISGVALLLALFLSTILPGWWSKRALSNIPLWGEDLPATTRRDALLKDSKAIYFEAYLKYKQSLGFRVSTTEDSGEKLVVSPKFLPELIKLPPSVLSFEEAHKESFEQKYTNSPPPKFFDLTPHIIKADLGPALSRLNPSMTAKADAAVLEEIGQCAAGWTPVKIYPKMLRIIAIVSGSVFIGPELCHDERYLDAAVNYTAELGQAVIDVKSVNFWLKRFLARRLGSVAALRRREEDFLNFITPIVQQRIEAHAKGGELPPDMLTWLVNKAARDGINGTREISLIQLGLFFVASHTTGITLTNIFYDLAAHPESIAELRAEIRAVQSECENGVLTHAALQRLKRLDSFMKESLRMHPLTFATFERRVLREFTLSDGTYIPPGTILEIPNHAISRDPEVFEDPETFKPWRFLAEMRNGGPGAGAEKDGRQQFVSVSQTLGSFGYGRHACPGRFFAAVELKMILARAILTYDMRLKDGVGRPRNLEFGLTSAPDPEGVVVFKRVDA